MACFSDPLFVLVSFSAARTGKAAGLLQRIPAFSRQSTEYYPELRRRAGSSSSHVRPPTSPDSSSTSAFLRDIIVSPPATPSTDHASNAATLSKDSWSGYLHAASAAEKAAPELFDEVTSRPTTQKRPRPVLSEDEKRRRRLESIYRSTQRAKGLVVPAAPGYADRAGTNHGKRLRDKDLSAIPVLPLTVPIARAGRQRAQHGVQGLSASSATKLAGTSGSTPGSSQPPSAPQAGQEPAAEGTRHFPATAAPTHPETPEEKRRRRTQEAKERSRLRAKGVAIPPRPGYESRTGPNRNKPSGPPDPSVPETDEARKRRLAKESKERMKLRAAGVPVPLRRGGSRTQAQGSTGPSPQETPEETKRRLIRERVQRTRLRAAGVPVPAKPGYASRLRANRKDQGVSRKE